MEVFRSKYLDQDLLVEKSYRPLKNSTTTVPEDEVFYPLEAELFMLPFMLENKHLFKDATVLEIGSGSGIISIFAAKLGAKKVIATDISSAAIDCTNKNAKRFKYDGVITTRLVDGKDQKAFSVIAPQEKFDVIISNPPYSLDLSFSKNTPVIDNGELGVSLVTGIGKHLTPKGKGILLYRSLFYQQLIVKFAKELGLKVEHELADVITPWEMEALFNSYAKKFSETFPKDKKIPPFKFSDFFPNEIKVIYKEKKERRFPGIVQVGL